MKDVGQGLAPAGTTTKYAALACPCPTMLYDKIAVICGPSRTPVPTIIISNTPLNNNLSKKERIKKWVYSTVFSTVI